jgi:SAM-dependent methyltransferase
VADSVRAQQANCHRRSQDHRAREKGGALSALSDRDPQDQERVRVSYDALAAAYTQRVHGELDGPLDRGLLTAFAEQVEAERGAAALVCDLGSGPGHVGAFLVSHGLKVTAIDLSPAMVEIGRHLYPEMTFEVGTMTALDVPDLRFDGIVAFYSIVHLTSDAQVRTALGEIHRCLVADGLLLIAVPLGEHGDVAVHADDMLDVGVDLDFRLFAIEPLTAAVEAAGFRIEAQVTRAPYPDAEAQTECAYLLARKVT